jgi:uncharacterized protein (DUF2252 family)
VAILAALASGSLACGGGDRDATIVTTFVRADEALLRTRPALVEGRYARMAASPVDFYRGSLALYLRDWRDGALELSFSRFAVDLPMPLGVGDPHVENFGTLLGRDGRLTFEPNDLDGADRVPYLWDLRRLTVGLCVAARAANAGDPVAQRVSAGAAREVARAAALAYADAMRAAEPGPALTEGGGVALLEDLFRRARRDAVRRDELATLTVLTAGARSLRRGVVDPEEPAHTLTELPPWVRASLPALLERYRSTLTSPPDGAYLTVLDAAREHGSGVASWPRVRVLALLRGPSDSHDDDVIVEVKEQTDALVPGGPPPGVYFDDVPSRVLAARAALWSRPDADPLWGATTWFGVPVQVRTETAASKSLRVARMTGALGTPEALGALATTLGALLGRAHRRSLPTPAPQALVLGQDRSGFADEQAEVSSRYAAQVLDDWQRFGRLLRERGPTLGFTPQPEDAPSSPARELFGTPSP